MLFAVNVIDAFFTSSEAQTANYGMWIHVKNTPSLTGTNAITNMTPGVNLQVFTL